MKKLLIAFLTGSILIGIGLGVMFIEISEYGVIDFNPEIKAEQLNKDTIKYSKQDMQSNNTAYDENGNEISVDIKNLKNHIYMSYSILSLKPTVKIEKDEKVTDGFEIDVLYRGEKPYLSFNFHYIEEGIAEYYLSAYDNMSPKEFFDIITYMSQNKVFVRDPSNFIVESVIIRTNNPENFII